MDTNEKARQEPEALNAEEFMWEVVAATPALMREINGVVNVDMRISIDESGRVDGAEVMRCKTIVGLPVKPDQAEIVEAAQRVIRVLRFRPAAHEGIAVRRDGLEMSFGFSTAALDSGIAEIRRSMPTNGAPERSGPFS